MMSHYTSHSPLDQFVVVLDRPQNPLNVGAVVRAVKNLGYSQLRLVDPAPFAQAELLRVAHHSEDLLARMESHPNLEAALADTTYVVGTAAEPHPEHPVNRDIRGLARTLLSQAGHGRVALLFGTEADGLPRAALDRCHVVATLPVNPQYAALNLAQAVLLFLWEIRMAAGTQPDALTAGDAQSAPAAVPQAALERFFVMTEEALAAIDFFKYNPAAVMRTLRQIAYRAALRPDELALLMAIASQMQWAAQRTIADRRRSPHSSASDQNSQVKP